MKFVFQVEEQNIRIDKYLSKHLDYSRSIIQDMIEKNNVFVNGQTVKSSYKVEIGDLIVFNYKEDKIQLIPKDLDLDIFYEDEDILLVNKDKNMIVHPANNDQQETLVNGLIYRYKSLGNMNSERPGIVHRLDKDTTGALVIAKTDVAYKNLVDQFSNGQVERKYLAIVHGNIESTIIINKKIGRNEKDRTKMAINEKNGKDAISVVRPLENFKDYSFLDVELKTGRTHQIRVHLASINHSVVGDLVYGRENKFGIKTQMLHSYYLAFKHPRTNKKIEFKGPTPNYFLDLIGRIKDEENFKS